MRRVDSVVEKNEKSGQWGERRMRTVGSVVEKKEKSGRIPCSRREVNLSKMCWQRRPDARDRQDKCSSFKSGGFVWVYHLLSPSSDTTDILRGGYMGEL
jgi:hypothetical protein